jgi:hypothetical protein
MDTRRLYFIVMAFKLLRKQPTKQWNCLYWSLLGGTEELFKKSTWTNKQLYFWCRQTLIFPQQKLTFSSSNHTYWAKMKNPLWKICNAKIKKDKKKRMWTTFITQVQNVQTVKTFWQLLQIILQSWLKTFRNVLHNLFCGAEHLRSQ